MNIWVENKSDNARWVAQAIAGGLKKVIVFETTVFSKCTNAEIQKFTESLAGQGVDVVVLSNRWDGLRTEKELLVGDSDPKIQGLFVPFDEDGKERAGDKIIEDVLNVLRENKLIGRK